MWKEKLGNYLIDVSKYILTGVVIASLVKDIGENRMFVYGLGLVVSLLTLCIGLLLSNKKENKPIRKEV